MKTKLLFLLLTLVIAVSTFCGVYAFASDEAPEATLQNEETAPKASFYGATLVLSNTVQIRYIVRDENVADYNDISVLVWKSAQDEYVSGTEDYTLTYNGKTTNIGGGVKLPSFDFNGVGPQKLADDFYAVVALKTESGVEYSAPAKYSVLNYAYARFGKLGSAPSTDENLVLLLEELLEYGAASQKYTKYKTDRLATADFYQIKTSGGKLADGFTSGFYLEGEKVTLTAPEENADGLIFASWQDSEGNEISSEAVTEITVGAKNEVYTAIYKEAVKYSDGLAYTKNSDGTYTVTGIGTCADTDIIIPPTYNGAAVVSIEYGAFRANSKITSVSIPDCITSINPTAFEICASLNSINVDENNSAYMDIDGNLYTKDGKILIQYAIAKADTEFTVPDGVIELDAYAFSENRYLKYVDTNGVEIIGTSCFQSCNKLESVSIFDRITSVGSYAFSYSYNIVLNSYDNGLYLGNENNPYLVLIYGYSQAITTCEIHPDTKVIADNAFYGSVKLTHVTLGASVTHIGEHAFASCSVLKSLFIENKLVSIDERAFDFSKKITDLYYLGTAAEWSAVYVNSIGNNAIRNATVHFLTKYEGKDPTCTEPGWNAYYKCSDCDYSTYVEIPTLAHISVGEVVTEPTCDAQGYTTHTCVYGHTYIDSYVDALGHNYVHFVCTECGGDQPESNVELKSDYTNSLDGIYSISGVDNFTDSSLVIPSLTQDGKVITHIGYGGADSFSKVDSLVEIKIPGTVVSIRYNYLFANCPNLSYIAVDKDNPYYVSMDGNLYDKSVTTLIRYAPGKTEESFLIPSTVKYIATTAFYNCKNLKSVTFPEGVTTIGEYAFRYCSGLTSVTIPDSVTSVGKYAFANCSALAGVKLSANMSKIENYTFYYCTSLESVTVPAKVKAIGNDAFFYCYSLKSAVIGSGVTAIGDRAFSYCRSLTSVVIPEGVTKIGVNAFNMCDGLTSVTFKDTTTWYKTSNSSYTGGSKEIVTTASINATYLKMLYAAYYWYKV